MIEPAEVVVALRADATLSDPLRHAAVREVLVRLSGKNSL
jgi:hypothetical protein